jgi:AcrR family transcriptional regulator
VEFADRGYEAASLNRIIERAGISKGTLYYYFEDKEDLFATVLEHASRRLLAEAGFKTLDGLDRETFWDSFRTATRRSMELLHRDEWFVRLARSFRRFRDDHASSAATSRINDLVREATEAFVQRGQELGTVRTDLPVGLLVELTRAVEEAGDGWMLDHWEELDENERERMADARMDLLRDMLDADHQGWDR